MAFSAFDVDVDIRQGGAVVGDEPFKDESVLQGIYVAYLNQVIDQAGRPGPTGCRPDSHVLDHPGYLCNSQEVGREPQVPDDPQFMIQPCQHRCFIVSADPREPLANSGMAPLDEFHMRIPGAAND